MSAILKHLVQSPGVHGRTLSPGEWSWMTVCMCCSLITAQADIYTLCMHACENYRVRLSVGGYVFVEKNQADNWVKIWFYSFIQRLSAQKPDSVYHALSQFYIV